MHRFVVKTGRAQKRAMRRARDALGDHARTVFAKRLVALKVGHVALVSVGSAVVEQQAIFSGDDL
ncbi:hypothetical protein, partial [Paraburkholderia bengalensis]|uniref:hypothetical protein n=1 Tax=Paraburkholderia bengalensis TaxID=2747562 RepID=UPI003014B81F